MLIASAILLDYTFQTSSPFIDTVINKVRQCTPLVHDCLSQLFQFQQYTRYYTALHKALSTRFRAL